MEKLNVITAEMAEKNIEMLGQLFPNCLTEKKNDEGKIVKAIDFDKLRQELADSIVEGQEERYQFTWPDKRNAIRLANAPTTKTLRPCREESVDFDNTQNLYIEGDNLDVLKILRENYLGKVKMIYIDPPYNTGNDFVYNDDFSQTSLEYIAESGQFDSKGNRLVLNTESNGRFHTDWLNMMYSRLRVAKDLLSNDGVIFISIDDNEASNLKKICDEIFGERNFVNQFAWVSNITGRQISGHGAAKTWEIILAYTRSIDDFKSLTIDIQFAKENMPDTYKGFDKDIREDKWGKFAIGDTLYNHNRKFNEETRRNLVFSIFWNPETDTICTGEIGEIKPGFIELPPHPNGDGIHKYHAWRWSRQKIEAESHNLIVLPVTKGYEIYTRIREFNQTLLKDIITNISNGDSEVQKLFGGKKYFDYPKSVALLATLVGSYDDKEILVLDFFSGSATTAHAVMKLNAKDHGNRKFIMVQLPEETDENSEAYKAGYKNICEIGKERIRRAGAKVKEDGGLQAHNLDIGFRVLKLDSANEKEVKRTPSEFPVEQGLFDAMLDDMAENIKEDRTPEDLLFQVLPMCNLPLSCKIESKDIDDKCVFVVEDGYLVACFDENINEEVITAIAKMKPYYFIMRDSSLATDNVADNFDQIFNAYSKDTIRRIL